jgi:hypothetical protein
LSRFAVMRRIGFRIERPARPRREGHIIGQANREALDPCPSDHCAIIGAKRRWRHHQVQTRLGTKPCQRAPNPAVGTSTSRNHHSLRRQTNPLAKQFEAHTAAIGDRIDYGCLKRGT